ncbi:helix-turn-helix domain-containing protein [Pseudomonas sp. RW10S2]|uniref:GlxA family transcriptional regulator n=1 Tax=unclassified Pseudomonas TaxID=196821 RepID=UPI001648A97A|nr:helix-turn-helix domain-containing protein [Pseudomonas sp. RW10S2]MBC3468453.1 helix-turn-helix domain-containing protein [Pseudomonas sp. RW10S2]QXI42018.1 helix-turn-helix domain-containing protein [Pseudomonas wayambapalatensis]
MPSLTLAILAMPGVQLLDASGPLDVFAEANRQAGREVYRLRLLACEPGPLVSSSGARLLPDGWIGDTIEPIDTLLIAGTPQAASQHLRSGILDWLRGRAASCRRYGSVCTGAFALAAAGLLDGRRITTHWAVAEVLAERYPEVQVEADAIQVHDGKVRTAAGVTSGLDLALSLVEEDLGRELAKQVAGQLVMYFKRPGGQLQFSRQGGSSPVGRSVLQGLQRYVAANPAEDHSIASLAQRAGLSPRHFARLFQADVGMTPAAWVELARVNAARERLEGGREPPKQVAALCGFANVDTLRRAFVRHVGVTPADYRKRYARTL